MLTFVAAALSIQAQAAAPAPAPIEQVEIGPLYREPFVCAQHPEGQLAYPGDALGSDCMITGGTESETAGFARLFRTDGTKNEDWYGWGAAVLAPFDGVVRRVHVNDIVNAPGTLGKPPASMIVFERADGTRVLYAHVADLVVKEGDSVIQGQTVAKVGNNGFGRSPHIHVGAFRGGTPLQIRWDLKLMGQMLKADGN